jgi:Tfp pilus assembly protein PilF
MVYTALGVAYLVKREYNRALENCNRAIQLNPEDYAAYSGRGGIYIIKDEYERGIKDMETSLRINPDQPDVRNQLEIVRKMQKTQK